MATMKSFPSGPFLLLLFFLLCSTTSGSVLSNHYKYIYAYYTWQEAQSYCRSHYTDLATIYVESDKDRMNMDSYSAFIGLYKVNVSSWQYHGWGWSDGQIYYYGFWAPNEPHYSEKCAVVSNHNKRFYGTHCDDIYFFICHEPQGANNLKYTFIPEAKTWSEAQEYCRNNYADLATIKDSSDMTDAVKSQDFPVWTGMHREGGAWKWSLGNSEYEDWASNEPGSNGDCVSILSLEKKMATHDCSTQFPFICMKDNLILVKENKTWEEALEHCREIARELVSLVPGDHVNVVNRMVEADTDRAWTGLRFLAGHWLWVNGAPVLYPDLPSCPIEQQNCGVFSRNGTGSVETADCLERRNFLCYS